jgi:hypothetical protein
VVDLLRVSTMCLEGRNVGGKPHFLTSMSVLCFRRVVGSYCMPFMTAVAFYKVKL